MALAGKQGEGALAQTADAGQTGQYKPIIAGDGPIQIPSAELLFTAEFVRSGSDLKLVADDGSELLIANYFGEGAPDLIAPNHAMLGGDTVSLLAGPQFPGQYAQAGQAQQAGEPVGNVETLQGTVTVQRADGTTLELKAGDPVFKSDVVTTGPGSSIGLKLSDGTLLTLQEASKLAINEFVYQPDGADNSALLNVIQGTFSLFAGQVAPTGDMKIQTPIATMGIRGTSILGVNVNAILGRLSLTQDPDGKLGFVDIFNNANGNLFTVLRTVFEKITVSENGLLSITPKTPEELAFDQNLTQLLHNFYEQVPQQGPDENQQPQGGRNRFDPPNIREINLDNTPPDPNATELLLPADLLEEFLEFLLNIPEIRDEILLALSEAPSAGNTVLDDQPEGEGGDVGGGEGGDTVGATLPFDFGSSGPGSVGFAALDGQPARMPGPDGNPVTADGVPVTSGGVELIYSWDAGTNTLTALAGEEEIFSIVVNPVTGEIEVTISGAVDHLGEFDESLSIDIPFTVQAANGQTVTGALTLNVADDIPEAKGDSAEVSGPEPCEANVIILLDTSKSMKKPASGDNEYSRFDLAKAAVLNLLAAAGIGQALVIDFANSVHDSNWGSAEEAANYINGLSAGGKKTNLDGALERAVEEFWSTNPEAKTYIYVVSDGGASSDSIVWNGWFPRYVNGDNVNEVEEILWKLSLHFKDIDGVFGYSVGGNADDQLVPVGWDPDDPFERPDVADLENPFDLIAHFYEQIGYQPAIAEGNVLDNDDLGADGLGEISSIVIDGETYESSALFGQQEQQQFLVQGHGEDCGCGWFPIIGDGWIVVQTAQGGLFSFQFTNDGEYNAGDWHYMAPPFGNTLPYEHIRYTVTDGDGDQSTSDLIIEIEPETIDNVEIGGEGDDTLTSVADDTEVLVGGLGADNFVLNSFDVADFIADYDIGEGDAIDLSELLADMGVDGNNINQFVQIVDNGDGAVDELQVKDGESFKTVAVLDGDAGVNIIVEDGGNAHTVHNPVNV